MPSAQLLDLRKAYHRVNKVPLWHLSECYGLNGDFLHLFVDMHETTECVMREKEGNGELWVPGCG